MFTGSFCSRASQLKVQEVLGAALTLWRVVAELPFGTRVTTGTSAGFALVPSSGAWFKSHSSLPRSVSHSEGLISPPRLWPKSIRGPQLRRRFAGLWLQAPPGSSSPPCSCTWPSWSTSVGSLRLLLGFLDPTDLPPTGSAASLRLPEPWQLSAQFWRVPLSPTMAPHGPILQGVRGSWQLAFLLVTEETRSQVLSSEALGSGSFSQLEFCCAHM